MSEPLDLIVPEAKAVVIVVRENNVVTEQLPEIEAESIRTTPSENSIKFFWTAVEGATSYTLTLAPNDSPDFKKTVFTPEAEYKFEELAAGLYHFAIQAVLILSSTLKLPR